jgi:hypothetical protein
MKALHLFETAGPVTQRQIPEEWNFQLPTLTILSRL